VTALSVSGQFNAADLPKESAIVVRQVSSNAANSEERLQEIWLLAESAGAQVVATVISKRYRPDSVTFIGKGKVEEVRQQVSATDADVVIVDSAITPVQERNLEREVQCRVIDRTRLILDIFSTRAKSGEGKLQVELAQLKHWSTRLIRGWTHLERQKGGIGLRGPGETQLETDRRLIGDRIKTLTKRLNKIQVQRQNRRAARDKVPVSIVALVGYTNAGKSSLFNRLSGGMHSETQDRLFSTLDTTMRKLDLPDCGEVVVFDTVGFIRDLPHTLVTAFHATLEEVSNADALLHVVDATSENIDERIDDVETVLEEIGAAGIPTVLVLNKTDLLDDGFWYQSNSISRENQVQVSAHSGEGVNRLFEILSRIFRENHVFAQVKIPSFAGKLRSEIYQRLGVCGETVTQTGETVLDLEISETDIGWLNANSGFKDEYWQVRPKQPVGEHHL